MRMASAANKLSRMLRELGRVSDERGRLTRTFLSPAMRRANSLVGKWMREAGLKVRQDAVGNVIGRIEATGGRKKTATLWIGSHLDTVRDAGRFDGALGVLLPIVAISELRRRGIELPFAVEVLGFSEEEGVRFASAYLGSKGFTGQLRARDLALRDANGISVAEALGKFSRQPAAAGRAPRNNTLGYLEVHIEQGPVLENAGRAVGVVSAIAGQTRVRIIFQGKAGHAGTTPMELRRDALAGAAEFVLRSELLARKSPGLVATVGTIGVEPAAPNVIPARATLSLDLRHPRDLARRAALRVLSKDAKAIARRRGLAVSWDVTQDNGAVTCSPRFTGLLAKSVRAVQGNVPVVVSGAGHDAVAISAVAPVAMLFVRCRDGLSHHPDEHASTADIAVALKVVEDFLARMAKESNRDGI
jgi:allantoate deiminase